MLTHLTVHGDWYEDGLESNENCWRLDVTEDYQVQLFATFATAVKGTEDKDKPTYDAFRLVIERDVRDKDGERRIDYAFDSWYLRETRFVQLLASSQEDVSDLLEDELYHVWELPTEPEYLDSALTESTDDDEEDELYRIQYVCPRCSRT